ncbi:DUF3576 domain-containing protein [Halocynthiibacter namhaensis]|uniref:DUF3576 domain-containing protein n=1 Tax=Halocynthiibacter namhaensis TaxID=1290553 RepID=UPI0005791114|nr:DUF3576 domain-containing protein [Halocynthiibacter namhaensis]
MTLRKSIGKLAITLAVMSLVACGGNKSARTDQYSGTNRSQTPAIEQLKQEQAGNGRETIWDIFNSGDDSNVTLEVNKYIWRASLETLNFLPIQTADPFSGVISTGYGTPPGGNRSYRATVYITDPALDARSLNLSLQTRGGRAVDADTRRAVEDAILTRARQLRIAEGKL